MATPSPCLDFSDPRIQRIRDACEFKIYGDSGGVATDEEIARRYLDGLDRPRVCALMADVLTGRWGLGTTTVDVADKLGTDHSTISRALRWGELPQRIEGRLMACRKRPADWMAPVDKVLDCRYRSAYIFVADYLASRTPAGSWRKDDCPRELHAELLFQLLELQQREYSSFVLDSALSRTIVRTVTEQTSGSDAIPFWYTKQRHRHSKRLISRLENDAHLASRYLKLLLNRWEGIFVLTRAAIEEMEWV